MIYAALSFARVEVPEGEVEELADGAWLVVADKPVVFAVGEGGVVLELSLTPCGVECVGELKRAAALAAIAMAKWAPAPPAKRPEAIARELVVEALRRGRHRVELDPATYAAVLTYLSRVYAVGKAVEVKRDDASYAIEVRRVQYERKRPSRTTRQ